MSYEWRKMTRPDLELKTVRDLGRGGRLEYSGGSAVEKKVPGRHNKEPRKALPEDGAAGQSNNKL